MDELLFSEVIDARDLLQKLNELISIVNAQQKEIESLKLWTATLVKVSPVDLHKYKPIIKGYEIGVLKNLENPTNP